MQFYRKSLLAACAPFFLLGLSAAEKESAKQDMKPLMTERGKLLFSDDFGGSAMSSDWKTAKGKWSQADGALKGVELAADKHAGVVIHPVNFHDAVFQFSFKFDGGKQTSFSVNNQDGHVSRVIIKPDGFSVVKDASKKGPEKAVVLETCKMTFQQGQWYDMLVEI